MWAITGFDSDFVAFTRRDSEQFQVLNDEKTN